MRIFVAIILIAVFAGMLYQPEKGIAETGKSKHFISPQCGLRTGDVILRRGKGFVSELFRKTSRHDRQYSHAGIVRLTSEGIMVVHMLGETVQGTTRQELLTEPIEDFCSSESAQAYAIYRYPFLDGKEKSVNDFLTGTESRNIRFDEQFDLDSDSALYCTELIYKMCLIAGNKKLPISDFRGENYVGLDDLYRNNTGYLICKQIY